MNGYKVMCIVLTSALLVSLGTHFAGAPDEAGSLARSPRAVVPEARGSSVEPSRRLDGAGVSPPELIEAPRRRLDAERELGRPTGWDAAIGGLVQGDLAESPELRSPTEAIVDDVAREHLRRHWNEKRGEIIESLRDVGSDEWVAQEVDKQVTARTERFALDEAERERIRDGYDTLWSAHAEELAASIADEDWQGVMAQASEIWADEDALLETHLQPDEYEAFLAEEERGRVTLVAVLATLADLPWNDGMLAF